MSKLTTKANTMGQDDFKVKVLCMDESNQLSEEEEEVSHMKSPI